MASGVAQGYFGGQREGKSFRGQLPEEVTGFVGRKAELARIGALLGSARLITVSGPGGVGKTRVALRAAAQAEKLFPDGVCFVELSGLLDPELLPNTVARRLGLLEQTTRPALDAVLDYLRDARLLLILDTCEHLVDACAMLADAILRETTAVTVLATSRQPLDVLGEHTCLIPPLPVPPDDGPGGITGAAGVPAAGSAANNAAGSAADNGANNGDAVDLFAQRAGAAVPGFRVTVANRADAIRLCQRLDGIPLAIELAAVRLRALPLPELTQRLEYRFQFLSGGRRGAVPRHQTLRMAIEWSHDLCSPAEQTLWARLSVFASDFDLEAIEEVCADPGTPRAETVQTLSGLIDKSVVLRESADAARYRMLDTLREFGAEQLALSEGTAEDTAGDGTWAGGRAATRGRLAGRYLRLARRFDEHFMDDEQTDMFRELLREHASIRTALEYTLEDAPGGSEREIDGAELCTRLQEYWLISGQLGEGCHWLSKVLDRFRHPSPQRARALSCRGYLKTYQGDIPGALADIREASAMAEKLGERHILADSYVHLNLALTYGGQLEEAAAAGDEAIRRLEELGDRAGLIRVRSHITHLLMLSGRPDEAAESRAQALGMLGEDSKERWTKGSLNLQVSFALSMQPGREAECAALAREALLIKHELGDIIGMAYALDVLAWLAFRAGQHERTARLFGAADPLWQRAGTRLSGSAVLEDLYQRTVTAVREALGDERYAAMTAEGALQPLSLLVAQAVGEIPAPDGTGRGTDGGPGGGPGGDNGAQGTPALLTAREKEIAALIADGLSNREIGVKLFISKRTVDAHIEHIFGKLGISSRHQLTVWLRERERTSSPGEPA